MQTRIAVYDTSVNTLTLFQAVLTRQGYTVYAYSRELEDLLEVAAVQPHLIILGYLRGYLQRELQIVERLKTHVSTSHIPLLLCTTGLIHFDETHFPSIYLLSKPFDIADLMAMVEEILQKVSPD